MTALKQIFKTLPCGDCGRRCDEQGAYLRTNGTQGYVIRYPGDNDSLCDECRMKPKHSSCLTNTND